MRINYDAICNTADIHIDDVACCFNSAVQFKDLTGFNFPDVKKIFFEPERNIYMIERGGGICETGSDLPEMVWLNDHKQDIKSVGEQVLIMQQPVVTWRHQRTELLYLTDWMVVRHAEQTQLGISLSLSTEQYQQLLTYRQSLRDLTEENHELPPMPSFVQLG